MPKTAALARNSPVLAEAFEGNRHGWQALAWFEWAAIGTAYVGGGIFQARCLQLCYPDYFDRYTLPGWAAGRSRRGGVRLAGMPVEESDLRTSILVTGVTGSAKTAGILLPALAQLLRTHHRETADDLSREPFQKLGAFIPEVKGDLVRRLHLSGPRGGTVRGPGFPDPDPRLPHTGGPVPG